MWVTNSFDLLQCIKAGVQLLAEIVNVRDPRKSVINSNSKKLSTTGQRAKSTRRPSSAIFLLLFQVVVFLSFIKRPLFLQYCFVLFIDVWELVLDDSQNTAPIWLEIAKLKVHEIIQLRGNQHFRIIWISS